MSATEYVILVDENDCEIGIEEKLNAHRNNLLHRAFSIFIFRKKQEPELLLQQRAYGKYHSEGAWTNTCCSHPRQGESIIQAGNRRLSEEMNIQTKLHSIGSFHYNAFFGNGLAENEIDHVLIGTIPYETKITPNPKEVNAYRFITIEHLKKELIEEPKQFTPWFKQAFDLVQKHF